MENTVNIDDLILVSVDDHVVEPPGMFEGHIPDRYRDDAPKVVTREDGTDAWVFEGQEATNVGLNAVAGRPPDEYGIEPTRFSEMRPGCWDVNERVRDMNANGVLSSMNFPSYPQFCGQYFARAEDKDLALAVLRAYNDWHIDEWCGTHPGRMIPLALPPIWDPMLMADEVRRVAKKGCHAVTFSENPDKLGYPSLHSEHWDPFWKACSEEHTVVCLHIGSSSQVVITSLDAPVDTMITLQPMNIVQAAADLIWSRALREFPDLTFALSEGGIGWIPYFLERIDNVYKHHRAWTHQNFGDRLPSEVFLDRIVTCFIDDAFGIAEPRPPQHEHGDLGVRLSPLGFDMAAVARDRGRLPRRPAGRRSRERDAQERASDLLLRPLLACAEGSGDRGCPPQPGGRRRSRLQVVGQAEEGGHRTGERPHPHERAPTQLTQPFHGRRRAAHVNAFGAPDAGP